ncbi:D(4) dopamine receptor-like [Actinia tenebrosa]|uniref:D(4) dopamine receptor-like n=1 Tax=Actinia tenebrosa TaxID=6105 RepID=A0A6P8IK11_ACTTE|nr:D(4) dopamine receptor-like [Actinia tenebrosa]XP_031567254.1 D(4) dopamine receptor-like [Actinia tenebrosa]XP_031567255.1 D(4) dopamine receptor-like [Actinia tenebrosa]XP_031567256.1 D(4) dopamine receptor-like [Actinia tenebrosa]
MGFEYTNAKNLTNISSSANDFEAEDSILETGLKTASYSCLFLVSVLGNCLVILAYKLNSNGKLRTVSNNFIVSMAAADLLITVGSVPERMTRILANDTWLLPGTLGIAVCKAVNFIEKLSMNVSVLHLVSIAVDRFLVVFFPRRKFITKTLSHRIILSIWLISSGYCLPILIYGKILEENGKMYCKVRKFFSNWKIWFIFFLIILFGTFLLIVIIYSAIAVKLWRKKTPGVRLSFRSRRTEKLNIRIVKMVAMIVTVFYVCFLPYWIGWVFCSYHFNEVICSSRYIFIAIFLSYSNSSLNPIIYTIFNENFRFAFRLLWRKLFCVKANGGLREHADVFVVGLHLEQITFPTESKTKVTKSRSLDFLGTKL